MGFPGSEASWSVIEAGMYMGAGGSMPAVYTWIAVAACVCALWVGHLKEHKLYANQS
jgi:hypothetical protein